LYKIFFRSIHDYDLVKLTEIEAKEIIKDYISYACAKFQSCRQDLQLRDDDEEDFNIKLTSLEIEILSSYMTCEYLDSTYLRTPLLLKPSLQTKSFYSLMEKQQLKALLELRKDLLRSASNLEVQYSLRGSTMFAQMLAKRQPVPEPVEPEPIEP